MITPETLETLVNLTPIIPILKEGTPLAMKIIDTVSKGIGTIYKPMTTYLDEKAKLKALKDEMKELYEEKTGNIVIKKGDFEFSLSNDTIDSQIITMNIEKSIKEKINIDEIVSKSINIIQNKINYDYEKISKEEISEDWALRFFDISKNIRDEEMKNLWSFILADEIIEPGNYSLRTLETLKNMNKKDAELFTKICNMALGTIIPQSDEMLSKFGIKFADIVYLQELNLIQRDMSISVEANKNLNIQLNNKMYIVVKNTSNKKNSFNIYRLTNIGTEMYKLTNRTFNMEIIKEVSKSIKHLNSNLEIYYTDEIVKNNDESISYKNLNKID